MTSSEFFKLPNGTRVHWESDKPESDPPCDGTVRDISTEDFPDRREVEWDDDVGSMLVTRRGDHLKGFLSNLTRVK